MTEQSATTVSDVGKKSKKATATKSKAGLKKPADHPTYNEMVKKALVELKERGGSSRQAILKYILANFKVGTDEHAVNSRLKTALRNGIKSAVLKRSKGTGATGSFRLGEKQPSIRKKAVTKTSKSSKPATPKKTVKTNKAVVAAASPKKAVSKPKTTVAKTKVVKKPKVHAAKPKSPKKPKPASIPKSKVAKKSAKPKKVASPKKTSSKKA